MTRFRKHDKKICVSNIIHVKDGLYDSLLERYGSEMEVNRRIHLLVQRIMDKGYVTSPIMVYHPHMLDDYKSYTSFTQVSFMTYSRDEWKFLKSLFRRRTFYQCMNELIDLNLNDGKYFTYPGVLRDS